MAKLIVSIRNFKKVNFKIYDVTTSFSIQLEYTYCPKKIKLYGPFLWMGFNCLKARATQKVETTDNQTMKFGQLMEYNKRNTPFWRS